MQSVANILTNAAKYTDVGGEIRVELSEHDGQAVLAVTDNGAGIAPDLLPRVFDLFVKGDRTLDRAHGGRGVGLSIVKRMIEMHGGIVDASSPGVGRGSTFTIRLPLADAAAAVAREEGPPKAPARRILVVDDNEDAADTLGTILALDGRAIETAYSGEEALGRVRTFEPDVVLLDIGLPGIDGHEVARRIRAAHGHGVALVAVTGYGQDADRQRARAAGFTDHLVKPVEVAALQRLLAGFRPIAAARGPRSPPLETGGSGAQPG